MIPDNLITDARAKIIWGEDPLSVRCFLTANGIPVAEAEAKVREFVIERNAEIRKIGTRNLAFGGGLIFLGATVFYLVFAHAAHISNGSAKGCGAAALMVLIGIWKLTDGIFRVTRPKSEHGSIPDIDE